MTVAQLTANMTQKELCHWIAFFRLENERLDEVRNKKDEGGGITAGQPTTTNSVSQTQKDMLMIQQMMALAGKAPK